MNITGRTSVFLIAADPIAQVRAPEIFNAIFSQAGVDAVVVPVQVPLHGLGNFISCLLTGTSVRGLLLSIPHKTAASQCVDSMDVFAQAAGAVNAIRRGPGPGFKTEGALFDGEGFVKALDYFGISPRSQKILIAGAGGAGSAIGASLAKRVPVSITFYDSAEDRANATAARIREIFPDGCEIFASAAPQLEEFTLVINATPMGLNPEDPLPFDVTRIDRDAKVIDILMTPTETPLLRACAKQNICAFPGYEMLTQQVPDYLDFFGYKDLSTKISKDLSSVRSMMA